MKKLVISVFFFIPLSAYHNEATEHIKTFLEQYSRPVTVLEFGKESRYLANIAPKNGVGIMLSTQASQGNTIAEQLTATGLKNLVVLNPRQVRVHELETLGRCEHFDISIVDQETFAIDFIEALPFLLLLGDYLFCIVDTDSCEAINDRAQQKDIEVTHVALPDSKVLCCCKTLKNGLDIARWNMYGIPKTDYSRYTICSNFSQKTIRKSSSHTPWIPGINLVTFICCHGILPKDQTLIELIDSLKKIEHNDLVIGNMIVQGNQLAIIDFDDARRNVRQKKCIKIAQEFFRSGIRFSMTPENALYEYRNQMRKK